jgi:FkbM family methyltransferase
MKPIIVYHVGGGSDEFGPMEKVRDAGFALKPITFEAMDGQCIDDRVGEATFYVNKYPLSSGLLPTNPKYAREVHAEVPDVTWGQNTELDHTVQVRTITIDILANDLEKPDVISIDTQGAELRVLRGASETLKDVLCVVSEVEFAPIYEGQPLFDEQMAFLRPYGFRLMELFSVQAWHQGPKFGLGFLTVAEAVWLRFDYENLSRERVETLAKIAAGFGRMSYAMALLEHINGEVENEWLQALWKFRDDPELRAA